MIKTIIYALAIACLFAAVTGCRSTGSAKKITPALEAAKAVVKCEEVPTGDGCNNCRICYREVTVDGKTYRQLDGYEACSLMGCERPWVEVDAKK